MKHTAYQATPMSGWTSPRSISLRFGRAAQKWPYSTHGIYETHKGKLVNQHRSISLLEALPRPCFQGFCVQWGCGPCWLHQQMQYLPKLGEQQLIQPCHFKTLAFARSTMKIRKTLEKNKNFQSGDNQHIVWWEEKMEGCRKPATRGLIERLVYTNLLGLDENLRNGSLKEGSLNCELLEVKRRYPREVLLCRVGEFYEAVGFDACILVEYAGLNPMCGMRNDVVPRAGCPVMNLRLTLDELTRSGFTVCVYEEVKGPSQARQRKDRFVSGHAYPGSPYVYGLAGADIDLDFPEPVPVIGISRSARGYCLVSVLEMMRTFSVEDGLTEEALVAKLRASPCHQLFLHRSLRHDLSGLVRWGEYGEGGLLWAECKGLSWEWFDHDPVLYMLSKVRDLYDLDHEEEFRRVVFPSKGRPRPLYVGTALQIGILPSLGVPSLLKVLLPEDCKGLCISYMRDLLLNPPPYDVAVSIQDACKLMAKVTNSIPDFTCVSAGKLVKLICAKEANHIEFSRIQHIAEDILLMHNDSQLNPILDCLLKPTWLATGLQINRQHLVDECSKLVVELCSVLAPEGDPDQAVSRFSSIPEEYFQSMEYGWRGRVKRKLVESSYAEVDIAAEALNAAVENDFLPLVLRSKATDNPIGGGMKADICFARDHEAVWLKARHFASNVRDDSLIEEKIKALQAAQDGRGKKAGEDYYTTEKVEAALVRYKNAVEEASCKVVELLRTLAEDLKSKLNIVVSISILAVIAKTLFGHVSEARRRKWVFPTLLRDDLSEEKRAEKITAQKESLEDGQLVVVDLVPYWLDRSQDSAVPNTVQINSLYLLTGPNGGGKSSLLRSICAASLLGICGLLVPARSAAIPSFDCVMLRMLSHDSPADGKSSFQMEMSELRTMLLEVTRKSLVLVDELCRGTEVQKGTFIAASAIEFLDEIGCIGVLSTHLHGLLDMKLNVKGVVYKAMGTAKINGQLMPTWKLVDGVCRESLAFETARNEGVPERVIQRAEELYMVWQGSHPIQDEASVNTSMGASVGVSKYMNSQVCNGEELPFPGLPRQTDGLKFSTTTASQTAIKGNAQIMPFNGELPSVPESFFCVSKNMAFQLSCPNRISEACSSDDRESDIDVSAASDTVENIFYNVCKKNLMQMQGLHGSTSKSSITCMWVGAREKPPPATINCSCVYMLKRPDGKFYVGQTDNIAGRITAHRSLAELKQAPFIYVKVANKSVASELETLLINQLPLLGLDLINKADQNHRHFANVGLSAQTDVPF